ncbi:hypothetical protein Dimus_035569 [Dionaea muscipula]
MPSSPLKSAWCATHYSVHVATALLEAAANVQYSCNIEAAHSLHAIQGAHVAAQDAPHQTAAACKSSGLACSPTRSYYPVHNSSPFSGNNQRQLKKTGGFTARERAIKGSRGFFD